MRPRTELDLVFADILGNRNVYFQPPETVKMHYPCVLYKLETDNVRHADDTKYYTMKRYSVTVIDKDPDSKIADKMRELKYCAFDREYSADNLHHFVFTLYY